VLFELSGEHPSLPRAEVLACLEAECESFELLGEGAGFIICRLEETAVERVAKRLALTHHLGRFLGSAPVNDLAALCEGIELPAGSFSVRVRRFAGSSSPEMAMTVMKRAGGLISRRRKINLTHPDFELRALLSGNVTLYLKERSIDRDQYEERHVRSRPFFSPISLHPRYARALVNLTRIKEGETLLDPFCGTGGIVMEGALMGARILGSDISPEMIEGCRENLSHFNIEGVDLEVADVGDIRDLFGEVDAIASDPPYGRSATTNKEGVKDLHRRALDSFAISVKRTGKIGVVLPQPCGEPASLDLLESHQQRVHRSLTRHYCVLKRQ